MLTKTVDSVKKAKRQNVKWQKKAKGKQKTTKQKITTSDRKVLPERLMRDLFGSILYILKTMIDMAKVL